MDRRALLLGGAAVGAGVLVHAVDALAPTPAAPRSDRPHGGTSRALAARVVWHAAPATRSVALTVDDGPDPRWTPRVLDLLARHGVPATFFVVGERAARHPGLLTRAFDAGHEIGNHTWTHADLSQAGPGRVRTELGRTAELVHDRTGRAPTSVRPPWGRVDPVGLLAAAELGCDVVLWSELVRGGSAGGDLAQALQDVQPGSLLLAHDGGPTPTHAGLRAVDTLIGELRERGYSFATVSGLLADDGPADPVASAVSLPAQRTS